MSNKKRREVLEIDRGGMSGDYGSGGLGGNRDQPGSAVPNRLEDLIEEYGKDGNVDQGSNSRVFLDEETDSVWKIVPQYDKAGFISDQAIYSEAGVQTPTNWGMNVNLSEHKLGSSLVVKQDIVDDYRALVDLPTEEVARELVSMAEGVMDEGYSLDLDITNFGIDDNGQIVYLDDADPFSLSQPPSTDKMMSQLYDSVEDLDEDYGEIVREVEDLL